MAPWIARWGAGSRPARVMRGADLGRNAVRIAILAWSLASALVVAFGANPHAAVASPLQLHGALVGDGSLGIVSHRGAAALAPENTLSAMRVAIDQGVEFVETDVQLTADMVPVLMHDDTIDRTTTGSGRIMDRTYAELEALDAGSWFDAEYAGEPVPTLEEFLDLLEPSPARALVELKGPWPAEQLEELAEQLRSRHLVNRVGLQSFNQITLAGLQQAAPEFARVMLTREWTDATVEKAARLEASAVGARAGLIDERPAIVEKLRAVGIGSLVYTLNKEKAWRHAHGRGIDLVVTDNPVKLAEWKDGTER